ncbi:MAG: protein kinase [Pleurocapsa sp. SU_196_0]|nr:protein kinase [Pleurocapsa sp. SU_196_0]
MHGGRYSVGKVVGEGGFGITYLGANIARQQRVAIKEFYPQGATRTGTRVEPPRGVKRQVLSTRNAPKCLEEAGRIARFQHPGIVAVSDAFSDNNTAYIVMEYLQGENLETRVQRLGALPPHEVTRIAEDLLGALEVIHAAGLLHRDIKPDNIILCDHPPRAVLIDFGAAREFQTHHTQMHSLILTPVTPRSSNTVPTCAAPPRATCTPSAARCTTPSPDAPRHPPRNASTARPSRPCRKTSCAKHWAWRKPSPPPSTSAWTPARKAPRKCSSVSAGNPGR